MSETDHQRFDHRYDPAFQRGFGPGGEDHGPSASVYDRTERVPEQSTISTTHAEADTDAILFTARRNPYTFVLAIMSVAFVAAGVAAMFWSQFHTGSAGFGPANIENQIAQSLAYSFGAPMVTVGLASGVGLLFMAKWARPVQSESVRESART